MADLSTYEAGQRLDVSSAEALQLAKAGAFGEVRRNGCGRVLISAESVAAYQAQRSAENPPAAEREPVAAAPPPVEAESPPSPAAHEHIRDATASDLIVVPGGGGGPAIPPTSSPAALAGAVTPSPEPASRRRPRYGAPRSWPRSPWWVWSCRDSTCPGAIARPPSPPQNGTAPKRCPICSGSLRVTAGPEPSRPQRVEPLLLFDRPVPPPTWDHNAVAMRREQRDRQAQERVRRIAHEAALARAAYLARPGGVS